MPHGDGGAMARSLLLHRPPDVYVNPSMVGRDYHIAPTILDGHDTLASFAVMDPQGCAVWAMLVDRDKDEIVRRIVERLTSQQGQALQPAPVEKTFLSVREAAKVLQVGRPTVELWVRGGYIQSLPTTTGRRLIPRSEILRWQGTHGPDRQHREGGTQGDDALPHTA